MYGTKTIGTRNLPQLDPTHPPFSNVALRSVIVLILLPLSIGLVIFLFLKHDNPWCCITSILLIIFLLLAIVLFPTGVGPPGAVTEDMVGTIAVPGGLGGLGGLGVGNDVADVHIKKVYQSEEIDMKRRAGGAEIGNAAIPITSVDVADAGGHGKEMVELPISFERGDHRGPQEGLIQVEGSAESFQKLQVPLGVKKNQQGKRGSGDEGSTTMMELPLQVERAESTLPQQATPAPAVEAAGSFKEEHIYREVVHQLPIEMDEETAGSIPLQIVEDRGGGSDVSSTKLSGPESTYRVYHNEGGVPSTSSAHRHGQGGGHRHDVAAGGEIAVDHARSAQVVVAGGGGWGKGVATRPHLSRGQAAVQQQQQPVALGSKLVYLHILKNVYIPPGQVNAYNLEQAGITGADIPEELKHVFSGPPTKSGLLNTRWFWMIALVFLIFSMFLIYSGTSLSVLTS